MGERRCISKILDKLYEYTSIHQYWRTELKLDKHKILETSRGSLHVIYERAYPHCNPKINPLTMFERANHD